MKIEMEKEITAPTLHHTRRAGCGPPGAALQAVHLVPPDPERIVLYRWGHGGCAGGCGVEGVLCGWSLKFFKPSKPTLRPKKVLSARARRSPFKCGFRPARTDFSMSLCVQTSFSRPWELPRRQSAEEPRGVHRAVCTSGRSVSLMQKTYQIPPRCVSNCLMLAGFLAVCVFRIKLNR